MDWTVKPRPRLFWGFRRMHEPAQTVLLVDDDAPLLAATRRFLAVRGLEVIASDSPIGVQQLIREHEPHVLVLDLEMPALNGDALARLIQARAATKDLPIVFYSGAEDGVTTGLEDRFRGATFVHKSEGPAALYAAIRAKLRGGGPPSSRRAPAR